MTIKRVAFIGLGAMGYRMAAHLPAHFDEVHVWNRTFDKAEQHASTYGSIASPLAQAVTADVIFSCLPTSTEVTQLISEYLPSSGSIWVDCTSGVPDSAIATAQLLKQHGAEFLDAPVSGQTSGAEAGTLTVMVGGDADALSTAMPAINCFAGLVAHVGESGAGFSVKAVNNTLLAANLWAAAEGLTILKSHGVNLDSALQCINASSGQSLASSNIVPNRILNRTFPNTFALNLLAKDCGIAADLQHANKLPAPLLSQVTSLCRAASNQHAAGTADFSQLIQLLESWSHIELS